MFIPQYLKDIAKLSEEYDTWVNNLENTVSEIQNKWNLKLGKAYTENASCSYVISCVQANGNEAVLKLCIPHFEADDEAKGLQLLNGHPAVQVINCDKSTGAILLEKCDPGYSLKKEKPETQDQIICQKLQEIWSTPIQANDLRPLEVLVHKWNKEALEKINVYPDIGLAQEGMAIKNDLIKSTSKHVFLTTDLHAGNVLKAQREPWLVIDIKPFIGDPAYDLTQHLLNNIDRLQESPEIFLKTLSENTKCEFERIRLWITSRLACEFDGKRQGLAKTLLKIREL